MIILFQFHSITLNGNNLYFLLAAEPHETIIAVEPVPKDIRIRSHIAECRGWFVSAGWVGQERAGGEEQCVGLLRGKGWKHPQPAHGRAEEVRDGSQRENRQRQEIDSQAGRKNKFDQTGPAGYPPDGALPAEESPRNWSTAGLRWLTLFNISAIVGLWNCCNIDYHITALGIRRVTGPLEAAIGCSIRSVGSASPECRTWSSDRSGRTRRLGILSQSECATPRYLAAWFRTGGLGPFLCSLHPPSQLCAGISILSTTFSRLCSPKWCKVLRAFLFPTFASPGSY